MWDYVCHVYYCPDVSYGNYITENGWKMYRVYGVSSYSIVRLKWNHSPEVPSGFSMETRETGSGVRTLRPQVPVRTYLFLVDLFSVLAGIVDNYGRRQIFNFRLESKA